MDTDTIRQIEAKLSVELPGAVLVRPGPSKHQYVFLHGYADSPSSMARRLEVNTQPEFQLLLPRGPFPVPQYRDGQWRDAFSWYFREGDGSRTLIPPETGARLVRQILETPGVLDNRPVVLVGYSQGGILCPFVAREIEGVSAVVQVNSRYRTIEYRGLEHIPIHGLHSARDEVISVDTGRGEHMKLMASGFKGSFEVVPEMAHEISEPLAQVIWRKLKKSFEED